MFSLLGVTMQYKFCAWAGATFALAAFLNKRKHDSDSSQILSGVLFAVSGLAVVFMNGYHGEKARAFGSRWSGSTWPGWGSGLRAGPGPGGD